MEAAGGVPLGSAVAADLRDARRKEDEFVPSGDAGVPITFMVPVVKPGAEGFTRRGDTARMLESGSLPSGRPGARTCRYSTFEFLIDSGSAPRALRQASAVYQCVAAVAILVLIMIDSTSAHVDTFPAYEVVHRVVTLAWCVEHVLRLWCCVESSELETCRGSCSARLLYLMKPMMLMDTFILFALMSDIFVKSTRYRGMSALRIMRVLTLYRIERDFRVFGPVVRASMIKKRELLAALVLSGLVLIVASVIVFYIEAPHNPEFHSVFVSMWWATNALTTVGYGDLVPQTVLGRITAGIVAFIGTGMFGLFAGILADGFREVLNEAPGEGIASHGAVGANSQQERAVLLGERLQRHEEQTAERIASLQADVREALGLLRGIAEKMPPPPPPR